VDIINKGVPQIRGAILLLYFLLP